MTHPRSSLRPLLVLSVLCVLAAGASPAPAEETAVLQEFPGDPVAYVLPSGPGAGLAFADLRHQDQYLVCYRGVAMLDRNTDHPILVTQCFNLKLNRVVKVYFNWNQVQAFQIVDPKVAF
jgi:hypothetical protein